MMMHSSSLVAVNGNEGITVDISARNTTNALVPDVHGSNVNITNPHSRGSSLSIAAAAAAAPVGFDLDSPEDMDFEATRTKRS
jgi:hypothetical protein